MILEIRTGSATNPAGFRAQAFDHSPLNVQEIDLPRPSPGQNIPNFSNIQSDTASAEGSMMNKIKRPAKRTIHSKFTFKY